VGFKATDKIGAQFAQLHMARFIRLRGIRLLLKFGKLTQ
jgi:hypothetical protein